MSIKLLVAGAGVRIDQTIASYALSMGNFTVDKGIINHLNGNRISSSYMSSLIKHYRYFYPL